MERDEELADRDKEKKEKEREYGDANRHTKAIDIEPGDEVVVKRNVIPNKLASTFAPDIHKVIERKGAEAVVEAESGRKHRRNVSHLKRIIGNDSTSVATDPPSKTSSTANDGIDPILTPSNAAEKPRKSGRLRQRPV